jgi:UDPglucose 6-dehydrogenase
MRVSVIGTGYVGLVTSIGLCEKGHCVTCVDIDAAKIASIQRGVLPFYEPGLDELLRRNATRLVATTDVRQAVLDTDVSLIAVGTPFVGGEIDLGAVQAAVRLVGAALHEKPTYHVVVVKSTVVPGTTEQVVMPLLEGASDKRAGADFGIGVNPEFLTEGEAVRDFLCPD